MTDTEFGLPTLEQIGGSGEDPGCMDRVRQWLDGLYAAERQARPAVAVGYVEGWFRRKCRVEYLAMGLGASELAAEHRECSDAAAWFRARCMAQMARRAEIRAATARELAEGQAA